jgi:hypothetical protein
MEKFANASKVTFLMPLIVNFAERVVMFVEATQRARRAMTQAIGLQMARPVASASLVFGR